MTAREPSAVEVIAGPEVRRRRASALVNRLGAEAIAARHYADAAEHLTARRLDYALVELHLAAVWLDRAAAYGQEVQAA